jgi:putative transposase
VRFIDEYRQVFGVEPICRVLSDHGWQIAASTYRAARARPPSARARRDAVLARQIAAVHARHKGVFGARKMWLTLNRTGTPVARCTVERLMRQQRLRGVVRGKRRITTRPDPGAVRALDLVERRFHADGPNRVWVADFTYVPTTAGTVYVAFVIDVFSRRILGWRVDTTMTAALVLAALERAIWTRRDGGVSTLDGLIHHSDAGAQYTSVAFTDRLAAAGAAPSVGTVGDAYDNALAESTIGLYKTELIDRQGPWRNATQVEAATMGYIHWYNHDRPHSASADIPPADFEALYPSTQARLTRADPSQPQ